MNELGCYQLGLVGYEGALRLQERLVREVQDGRQEDLLILLQHHPVVTLGRGTHPENLLQSERRLQELGIELHESPRGGDITYHGPGQIVAYPILDLARRDEADLHAYIRKLEQVVMGVLASFGVKGWREKGLTGVWTEGGKVAAIGIRVQRWVTSHGFALNVSTSLDAFNVIVPCGISGRPVTSLSKEAGQEISVDEALPVVMEAFGRVFDCTVQRRPPEDILLTAF